MRAGNYLFGQFTKVRLRKSNKTAQNVRFRQFVGAGYRKTAETRRAQSFMKMEKLCVLCASAVNFKYQAGMCSSTDSSMSTRASSSASCSSASCTPRASRRAMLAGVTLSISASSASVVAMVVCSRR